MYLIRGFQLPPPLTPPSLKNPRIKGLKHPNEFSQQKKHESPNTEWVNVGFVERFVSHMVQALEKNKTKKKKSDHPEANREPKENTTSKPCTNNSEMEAPGFLKDTSKSHSPYKGSL